MTSLPHSDGWAVLDADGDTGGGARSGQQRRRLRLTHPAASFDERFAVRIPEVAKRAAAALSNHAPGEGISTAEAVEFSEAHCRILLGLVRNAQPPTESEVSRAVTAVVAGFERGYSLPTMLAVCTAVTGAGLQVLQETATSADTDRVLLAAKHIQAYLHALLPVVAREYMDEYSTKCEPRRARHALFQALVRGLPVQDLAERAHITVAPRYTVMHLYLPGAESEIGGPQRRVRRIQDIVDEHAGQAVLTSLDGHGGTVLMPTKHHDERLVSVIAAVMGVPVTVALSESTDPDGVPEAVEEVREIVTLARKLGRKPGIYSLADLLVEYQLTRPGRARDCLARVIAPLTDHPHLLETLAAYIRHEHSRQLAAKALHVHTNTLDYRLRRVTELTGLDPTQPSVARTLAAALLAVEAQ